MSQINIRKYIKSFVEIRAFTTLIGLVAIVIVFSFLTDNVLTMPRNIVNLIRQISINGILAIGMTFILIAGDIDLSVGAGVTLVTVSVAIPQVWWGWNTAPSVVFAVVVGIAIGAWHGFWVVKTKIPSFIVTLAGMSIYRGIALLWAKGQGVSPTNMDFNKLAHGYIPADITGIILIAVFVFYIVSMVITRKTKTRYGYSNPAVSFEAVKIVIILAALYFIFWISSSYEGFPLPGVVLVLMAAAGSFVTNKTTFGRSLYAIGGNREAARLSGIKLNKIIFTNFLIMGGLTSVAGLVLAARLQSGSGVLGDGLELDAIASCIIGGTSLSGGVGAISGAILGAAIMGVIDNGMSLMGLSAYYKLIIKGLVVLLAVYLDLYMSNRQKKVK